MIPVQAISKHRQIKVADQYKRECILFRQMFSILEDIHLTHWGKNASHLQTVLFFNHSIPGDFNTNVAMVFYKPIVSNLLELIS